jgi:hypothetical protein
MSNNLYNNIDIENGNKIENIQIKPISYLLTIYILLLSISEIVFSHYIKSNECNYIINVDQWFLIQGILSILHVLFAYMIYYYKYKVSVLQSMSYKIGISHEYDIVKMVYYGFCMIYQVFMVIWIILGTVLLLMECSFTNNNNNYIISISIIFCEYISLITFMKLVLSIKLLEV